jgi:tRNA (mo5U34)-methyltransferase
VRPLLNVPAASVRACRSRTVTFLSTPSTHVISPDYDLVLGPLAAEGFPEWADSLRSQSDTVWSPTQHGKLLEWMQSLKSLPRRPEDSVLDASQNAVTVRGSMSATDRVTLEAGLRHFHPWRKGPFRLYDILIDTEWRSDLKWNRIASHLDLRNRRVLDVGCGNGYYGWRMLSAGARLVLGLDPFLLYVMQFEAIRRFASPQAPHGVLPLSDADLQNAPQAFDTTFSMGVLYHRTSPIDHLQTLFRTLRSGGQLVLETIVLDTSTDDVLVPGDRYAKMRNVWFIPSVSMLKKWLGRTGFTRIQVLDVSITTIDEQRRTDWMTFESLADFLDTDDPSKTIEGYPAPVRAVVVATRP